MPNVPIGVPPPNLPAAAAAAAAAALISNQLIGMGTQFGQAPTGLTLQQSVISLANSAEKNHNSAIEEIHNLNIRNPLLGLPQAFSVMQQSSQPHASHDDNMDVEMEDAERDRHLLPINEHVVSLENIPNLIGNRLPHNHSSSEGLTNDIEDRRDRRGTRDRRNSGHDRDKIRDRSRRDSRDRDVNKRDGRDRERGNRWGGNDRERDKESRKEREKSLNDRYDFFTKLKFKFKLIIFV